MNPNNQHVSDNFGTKYGITYTGNVVTYMQRVRNANADNRAFNKTNNMMEKRAVSGGGNSRKTYENIEYGETPSERLINLKTWKKLGFEFLFGKKEQNMVNFSMTDNPISIVIPFAQVSKATLGLKTLGDASKSTLITTAFYKEIGISRSIGSKWFTPLGPANYYHTFLGRWSPFILETGLIYHHSK